MENGRSIKYYNENAIDYIQGTLNSDMSNCYKIFLNYLKQGQKILDLGCGSGRDSKAFTELGFNVISIDGSQAICREASKIIGKEVICSRFEDIMYENEFDGIWASASLLHVKRETLPKILKILAKALKKNGYLYASFKYGNSERVDGERYFNDYTENNIEPLFNVYNNFKCLNCFITEDVRTDRKGEKWINVITQKQNI